MKIYLKVLFLQSNYAKMKKRTLPTLPTANLDLLERLYKWGVVWIVLFIIFFAVHSNGSYLFRAASSLCFVGLAVLLVTVINKVLVEYLLKTGRLVFFILMSIFVIPMWAAVSTSIDACLLRLIDGIPFAELFGFESFFVAFLVRLIWFIATYALVVIFYYQRKENEEKIISDQLKSEKLDMELRYLKSQINPHFLFNALNNIYSMVYTHDDNAADGVFASAMDRLSTSAKYAGNSLAAMASPLIRASRKHTASARLTTAGITRPMLQRPRGREDSQPLFHARWRSTRTPIAIPSASCSAFDRKEKLIRSSSTASRPSFSLISTSTCSPTPNCTHSSQSTQISFSLLSANPQLLCASQCEQALWQVRLILTLPSAASNTVPFIVD